MKKILIVEDEKWQSDCYKKWLGSDYEVWQCDSGTKAIDKIDKSVPDLILLDIFLPINSGIQLLHELRSHVDFMDIPVILCSSLSTGKVDLSVYGVVEVLDKSNLNPKLLKNAIKRVLK